jgi:hypothetical protein
MRMWSTTTVLACTATITTVWVRTGEGVVGRVVRDKRRFHFLEPPTKELGYNRDELRGRECHRREVVCDTHNGAPSRHNGDGALEVWCRLPVLSFLDPWYLCHPPITTAHSLSHALPVSVPFSSSLPRTPSPALTLVHTHTHTTRRISMRTCGRFFPNYQPACVLIRHHQRERR